MKGVEKRFSFKPTPNRSTLSPPLFSLHSRPSMPPPAATLATSAATTPPPPALAVDATALAPFLAASVEGYPADAHLTVSKFAHGQSNPTYLLQVSRKGREWEGRGGD